MTYLDVQEFLSKASHLPIVDVRSPEEYEKGHIPGAVNIPLFDDSERAVVGTLYKQKGRLAAIEKGLEYTGPKMLDFTRKARATATEGELAVYCWRGGMRSNKMAWLFELTGLECDVLNGGYKAYRQFILDELGAFDKLVVLQGPTGSGKTEVLHYLSDAGEQVIDLEGLAHHKGSSFGSLGQKEQPTTLQFQNLVYEQFSKFDQNRRVWVESESPAIGKVYLPETLWENMNRSMVVLLDVPREGRVRRIVEEYGSFPLEMLIHSIEKIRKRFGGDRVKAAVQFLESGEMEGAVSLLLEYYDKAYAHSSDRYKLNDPVRIVSNTADASINADFILSHLKDIKDKVYG